MEALNNGTRSLSADRTAVQQELVGGNVTWTIHLVHICSTPCPPPSQSWGRQLLFVQLPPRSENFPHCWDEKRRGGGGPSPQERCLAGAYYGWAFPNKHMGIWKPQLWASPWLTSSPVSPPLTGEEQRENKRGGKRQLAWAKARRG